jgi:ABC-type transport system involved in cytochrome c biogenesis permease subunit
VTEPLVLGLALLCYGTAASCAIAGGALDRRLDGAVASLLALGLAAHTLTLAMRWARVGHGPFISMFEVLSSNAWSLALVFFVAYLASRAVRPAAAVALPVVVLLMSWMLSTHPDDGHLPATYRTLWLYAHVAFGKIFLGALLIAAGVAVVMLRRGAAARNDEATSLEGLALRFLALAFAFESLMLVTGAIWAQDAWGRFWAWDPLETWSFLTWLALAGLLHARVTLRVPPRATAALVVCVFVLAFLTFFGTPFVSTALHKGAV